jgi:ribonuclease VapC
VIVDASAIIAVILREPGFETLVDKLASTPGVGVGSPTLTEAAIVLSARLRRDGRGIVIRFVQDMALVVIPFGEPHWATAVDAWWRFGKGRHPAGLNFGDCMSYAIAKLAGRPLLCVGDDFARTDLPLA